MKAKPVLEHARLPAFEPQLKGFLEGAFDGGIRALEAAGYKLGDDLVNDDAREHFRAGIFSAFAQTQSAVGLLFIELEKKRRELLQHLKQSRRNRDPGLADIQIQLEAVANRQTILRRLMDGILWVLLPKPGLAGRLAFHRDVARPAPDELTKLLSVATALNRKAKREIYLVSDLTMIVQIGDIIRIRWDDEGVYLALHEIKSGHMKTPSAIS